MRVVVVRLRRVRGRPEYHRLLGVQRPEHLSLGTALGRFLLFFLVLVIVLLFERPSSEESRSNSEGPQRDVVIQHDHDVGEGLYEGRRRQEWRREAEGRARRQDRQQARRRRADGREPREEGRQRQGRLVHVLQQQQQQKQKQGRGRGASKKGAQGGRGGGGGSGGKGSAKGGGGGDGGGDDDDDGGEEDSNERERALQAECAVLRREKEEVLRKAEQRLSSEMLLRKSWKAKEADMKKRLEEKEGEIRGLQVTATTLRGGEPSMDVAGLRAVRCELKAGLAR